MQFSLTFRISWRNVLLRKSESILHRSSMFRFTLLTPSCTSGDKMHKLTPADDGMYD